MFFNRQIVKVLQQNQDLKSPAIGNTILKASRTTQTMLKSHPPSLSKGTSPSLTDSGMSTPHLPAFAAMEKSHLHHAPTEVSRAWGHIQSLTVICHSQDSTHATTLLFWLYISHQSTLLNARRLFFFFGQRPTPLITSAKKQTAPRPCPRGQCPAKYSLVGLQ